MVLSAASGCTGWLHAITAMHRAHSPHTCTLLSLTSLDFGATARALGSSCSTNVSPLLRDLGLAVHVQSVLQPHHVLSDKKRGGGALMTP